MCVLMVGLATAGRTNVATAPADANSAQRPKAVVLDFTMAPRVVEYRDEHRRLKYAEKPVETEKDVRGWWFGSNDVYYNANMGRIAADLFDEALHNAGLFNLVSRQDLRLYYADKKAYLQKKMKLGDKEAAQALEKLNPILIGRELGVEKVIVGHICDSEFRKNRTFGPFASVTSFQVSVYDVRTGELEFTRNYGGHDLFASQYTNFERRAARFVRDLKKHYSRHAN
ncbi:MAG: hypothetical protein D6691_07315 [Candidatus Hydrogenedentota bacterium]|nr:MAG: hypothetical protein D6691_07315 [Candidatus Hydrogenedentota bacterium]